MPAGAVAAGGRFEPLGGGKVLVPMALPVGFGATAEGLEEVMPLTLTEGGEPLLSWVEVLAMAARPESWSAWVRPPGVVKVLWGLRGWIGETGLLMVVGPPSTR